MVEVKGERIRTVCILCDAITRAVFPVGDVQNSVKPATGNIAEAHCAICVL